MGLDFSHCEAHWAYSGFHRFRTKLAREIGINLNAMAGFASSFSVADLSGTGHVDGLPWYNIKDDIKPLLKHSDCDGSLTPERCKTVAPRLRELVAGWDDDDYDKEQALELARGMEAAARAGEKLRFC